MNYIFKPGPELVWAIVVTVVAVLAQSVGTGTMPTDLKAWAISVAVGIARALLGLILSAMGPNDAAA